METPVPPSSIVGGINVMLEFLPFIVLEIGLHYNYGGYAFHRGATGEVLFLENAIAIPVIARFQYEWNRVLLYASVCPKFVIPIADYVIENQIDANLGTLPSIESRNFYIDINFALGIEFRVGKANYIGIRANYDLNVLSPIKSIGGKKVKYFYNDALTIGLTYRYAFNSKWKK